MESKYIVLEGLNFSGKTTVANKLSELLSDAIVTCQPSKDTLYGDSIRNIILNKNITKETERYLFLADRYQHLHDVIYPNLKEGNSVICDRNEISSIVFQGYMNNFENEIINMHSDILINHKPDIIFYIDIEPQTVINRQGDVLDRLDTSDIEVVKKRRDSYYKAIGRLKNEYNQIIYKIDGEKPVDKVVKEVYDYIILENYFRS